MKILVTDGNNRASLAIARSLGRKGHEVVVGETVARSLASSSRYCSGTFVYADPVRSPAQHLGDIAGFVHKQSVDVLLPVSDITTMNVISNREMFPGSCSIPFPGISIYEKASDKAVLTSIARSLDVAVPETTLLASADELASLIDELVFPIVIKPHRSKVMGPEGWISTSVGYADSKSDLIDAVSKRHPLEFPLLLQERIVGRGTGIFACYREGELIALFSHGRIREKPPSGGVSVLRESVRPDSLAKDYAIRLLDHLKWNGVAMVEFKHDQEDNTPKLMEINARFWGSLQLAVDSGVDFPSILIDSIAGQPRKVLDYKIGIKSRWLWGDVDRLLMILIKSDRDLDLPSEKGRKLRSIMEFLHFRQKDMYYEVFSTADIRPWFHETRLWFTDLIKGKG